MSVTGLIDIKLNPGVTSYWLISCLSEQTSLQMKYKYSPKMEICNINTKI